MSPLANDKAFSFTYGYGYSRHFVMPDLEM